MKKPELLGGIGSIIKPDFISSMERARLRRLLVEKAGLPEGEVLEFLGECGEILQQVLGDRRDASGGVAKADLLLIAANAKRLMQSIVLSSTEARNILDQGSVVIAHTYADGVQNSVLQIARQAGAPRAASLAWDFVEALEYLASQGAASIKASRQDKPDQASAKRLTVAVLDCYLKRFAAPPADSKSWFVEFMGELGKLYGLNCGPRIVRAAIVATRGV